MRLTLLTIKFSQLKLAFKVIDYLEKSTSVYEEYLNTTVVPPVKPTGGAMI